MLTTASQFVEATHALCKVYGQLQMDFVSVERVVELLSIPQEPKGDDDLPAGWPTIQDDIVFENVTMRYDEKLDPSLMDISFTIPGGSTCVVVGRTGSGKSTLAMALLATMVSEQGKILVGQQDISRVKRGPWRERVSFVAQDPELFPGTLRRNLDPEEKYTIEDCEAVLQRVMGSTRDAGGARWTPYSLVEGKGHNLSQGQRQLVGIGRAVMRRSPIVILDEATASIDKRTAEAIQQLMREEFRYSTVIAIAHRVEAFKDADHYIKLDGGRVAGTGRICEGANDPTDST